MTAVMPASSQGLKHWLIVDDYAPLRVLLRCLI